MSEFFSVADRLLLDMHGLASFDALWAVQLDSVDMPNTSRGGWSSVFRLELGDTTYYLKRQSNYLTHSLRHPFGEPTFACEFRNIQRYQRLGIPALQAAYFGARRVAGEHRAILLTRALDGWRDLDSWLIGWSEQPLATRAAVLRACAELARTLHAAGQRHGCFYPKHIFLRPVGERYEACLIDLEKTRLLLPGRNDRIADLEALLRRAATWSQNEVRHLLAGYLQRDEDDPLIDTWLERIAGRRRSKQARA